MGSLPFRFGFGGATLGCAVLVGGIASCSSAAPLSSANAEDAGDTMDAGGMGDAGMVDAGIVDTGVAADAFVPVDHPPFEVLPNQGGPIIASPEIISVTWANDPIADALESFDDWLVASPFWATLMAEWGVGPGVHLAKGRVASSAAATMDEGSIAAVVTKLIDDGKIPPPTASRIYAVYPPAGTTIEAVGSVGCTGFQAFHYAFDYTSSDSGTVGTTKAIYALAPRCTDTQGMSELDFTTWGMSHEIMEAATDPLYDQPAYRNDSESVASPELGENADLCTGHPTKVDGHEVTRNWSNVSAGQGKKPCAPAPDIPDFGAFADPPIVQVPPGGSATVNVRAWSSAPMAPFNLIAEPMDPALTAALSAGSAQNGDVLTLTISASKDFVPQDGSNLVSIYSVVTDYNTRSSVIVNR